MQRTKEGEWGRKGHAHLCHSKPPKNQRDDNDRGAAGREYEFSRLNSLMRCIGEMGGNEVAISSDSEER